MENENNKYEGCCWHCIPCKYENFTKEPDDKYVGDIFDQPFGFDSPHWLYRRFHKSYCKAQILANLSEYKLFETNYYEKLDKEYDISNAKYTSNRAKL